jgi:hypothetical protein
MYILSVESRHVEVLNVLMKYNSVDTKTVLLFVIHYKIARLVSCVSDEYRKRCGGFVTWSGG